MPAFRSAMTLPTALLPFGLTVCTLSPQLAQYRACAPKRQPQVGHLVSRFAAHQNGFDSERYIIRLRLRRIYADSNGE